MSDQRKITIIICIALTAAVLAIFWQVRGFDFVNYDDNLYVYENSHVLNGVTLDGVIWAFTTGHSANWHPLTWLSLMLDCQLFGQNPGWIHFDNLFLHVLNTLLLFVLFKEMTGSIWSSAFVAAVFALHPMHIQSVAWISERKDVLSTLFFIVTLIAYVNYVRRGGLLRYLLAILFFIFGLLAKPMLVTLPFVLFLLDYWPLNRFALQAAKLTRSQARRSARVFDNRKILYSLLIEKIPFFALAVFSSIITWLVQRSGGAVIETELLAFKYRIANMFLSYIRYIGKMFWPQNLAIFYPFDLSHSPFWQILLFALLLLFISVFVIYVGRKRSYLPVGWFWFVITLLPVIGLIQVGNQAFADRYTYIPYIGLFIMVAWGISELVSKLPFLKSVVCLAVFAVLAAMGVYTFSQLKYWKDNFAVFNHALEVTQGNHLAHYNLASDWYKKGNNTLALEHYKKAIEILPGYSDAAIAIGYLVAQQGNIDEAIEYFRRAIQSDPDSARAHFDLAAALQKQGKLDEAVAHYRQVVRLMPDLAEAQYALAEGLFVQGRFAEAVSHIKRTVEINPNNRKARNNLAWLLATCPDPNVRNPSDAIRIAQANCQAADCNDPVLLDTLAAAYASAGKFSQAIETDQKALGLLEHSRTDLSETIQSHLDLYKNSKPFIQSEPNAKTH